MRIASVGHAVFAALMIGLGIRGLITGEFTTVWQPVPRGVPARDVLVYLCALLSLASGIGLLWRRTAGLACPRAARLSRPVVASVESARRFPRVPFGRFLEFRPDHGDGGGHLGALCLVRHRLGPAAPRFRDWREGRAHRPRPLRPWLDPLRLCPLRQSQRDRWAGARLAPWHLGWAYFIGGTFIAAGVAILVGVLARPAAALSALQIGLFGPLVWVPILAAGSTNAFQRMEFATTLALTAAGWVVADSYRGTPWV
jgi:hypothetical protein